MIHVLKLIASDIFDLFTLVSAQDEISSTSLVVFHL